MSRAPKREAEREEPAYLAVSHAPLESDEREVADWPATRGSEKGSGLLARRDSAQICAVGAAGARAPRKEKGGRFLEACSR